MVGRAPRPGAANSAFPDCSRTPHPARSGVQRSSCVGRKRLGRGRRRVDRDGGRGPGGAPAAALRWRKLHGRPPVTGAQPARAARVGQARGPQLIDDLEHLLVVGAARRTARRPNELHVAGDRGDLPERRCRWHPGGARRSRPTAAACCRPPRRARQPADGGGARRPPNACRAGPPGRPRSTAPRYRVRAARTLAGDNAASPIRWRRSADAPTNRPRASQSRRWRVHVCSSAVRNRSASKTSSADSVRYSVRPSNRRTTIRRRQRGQRRVLVGGGSSTVPQFGHATTAGATGAGSVYRRFDDRRRDQEDRPRPGSRRPCPGQGAGAGTRSRHLNSSGHGLRRESLAGSPVPGRRCPDPWSAQVTPRSCGGKPAPGIDHDVRIRRARPRRLRAASRRRSWSSGAWPPWPGAAPARSVPSK